ncbi:hypothetical protein M422DRAFT_38042 [Sphaerobolus stellatus SS14]|uniref:Homeobox domain-containing protein n=1 Tax=Sphaerobolus stellatus (strain SS14) TaxID=990650 RepID=A0A0C9UNS9_SPHS4|nr:hypothetical protein M422DRAFT_38042 [Sphaerobolus stellatus SS14]
MTTLYGPVIASCTGDQALLWQSNPSRTLFSGGNDAIYSSEKKILDTRGASSSSRELARTTPATKRGSSMGLPPCSIPRPLNCRASSSNANSMSSKKKFGIIARAALEFVFAQSEYPSTADKELLAKGLRLTPRQVSIKFQNSRDRKNLPREETFPTSLEGLREYFYTLLDFGKARFGEPKLISPEPQTQTPLNSVLSVVPMSAQLKSPLITISEFESPPVSEVDTASSVGSPQENTCALPLSEPEMAIETKSIFNFPVPQWRRRAATQLPASSQTRSMMDMDVVSSHLNNISVESTQPQQTTQTQGFARRIYKALPRRAPKPSTPTSGIKADPDITPLAPTTIIPVQRSRKIGPLPRMRPQPRIGESSRSFLSARNPSSSSTSSFSSSSCEEQSLFSSRSPSPEPQLTMPNQFEDGIGFDSYVFSWEKA